MALTIKELNEKRDRVVGELTQSLKETFNRNNMHEGFVIACDRAAAPDQGWWLSNQSKLFGKKITPEMIRFAKEEVRELGPVFYI